MKFWLLGSLCVTVYSAISCSPPSAVIDPVLQRVPVSIELSETKLSLSAGDSVQIVAAPLDQRGEAIDGIVIAWASADSSTASLGSQTNNSVFVKGQIAGTTTISATVGDVSASATAAVLGDVDLPPLDSVVTPAPSDLSPVVAAYEAAVATGAEYRWIEDQDLAVQKRTYYDRSYAWFALEQPDRGEADQAAVMAEFVIPNNGQLPPRHHEPDGLVERYMRTGDASLLTTLEQLAYNITRLYVNKGYVDCLDPDRCRWEGRIQERALLTTMAADALSVPDARLDYRAAADRTKEGIISTQNPDGSWTPPGPGLERVCCPGTYASTNFMAAAAMSGLIRYAEYYGEDVARIQETVEAGAEWLWATQWRSDGSFNYWSDYGVGGPGPSPTPDLTMMFVDGFGWLYVQTNDPSWRDRGDRIFTAAVENKVQFERDINLHKQFSQFIRNSWRYLHFRDGRDLSHLLSPIEVHR